MAKTTTTDTATTAEAVAATVHQLDPRHLLVDRNIRTDARLDKDLVESVRQHGVLVTIDAVTATGGGVRVLRGQRRTLAAIEADRPTVPVLIHGDEDTTDVAEIHRIITQHAENAHRAGLTHREQVAAVDQLSLLGVSAAQITKRTRIKRTQVDAALAVAGSELATTAVERYDFLDLTQAAVLAEFQDDPATVETLVTAAQHGRFDHAAQRARDDRRDTQRVAAHAAALTEAGVTVITGGDAGLPLRRLRTADGELITPEAHATCPGHAAQARLTWGWINTAIGEPVTDDDVRDDTEDSEDSGIDEGDEGELPEVEQARIPSTEWICTDPAGNGHTDSWATSYGGTPERQKVADMDPEQAEAVRAERRDVRESNAAWRSAEAVRRRWVTTLCARKTPPSGAAAFVTTALGLDAEVLTGYQRGQLVAELLGVGEYRGVEEVVAQLGQASDKRAQVLALALVLAAYEANTLVGDWRSVRAATRRYLAFLDSCGYTRSDVERRACGQDPLPLDTAE